jgi:hypothetical protein
MPRSKLASVNAILVSMARKYASAHSQRPAPGRNWSGVHGTVALEDLVAIAGRLALKHYLDGE